MDYNELIETISEVVNNGKIHKNGLILTYELSEENHEKMLTIFKSLTLTAIVAFDINPKY